MLWNQSIRGGWPQRESYLMSKHALPRVHTEMVSAQGGDNADSNGGPRPPY